jgi:hypothetical protein
MEKMTCRLKKIHTTVGIALQMILAELEISI